MTVLPTTSTTKHAVVYPTLLQRLNHMLHLPTGRIAKEQSDHVRATGINSAAPSAPNQMLVQAIDFSQWLLQNVKEDDHVAVQMDIAGAEFAVVQQLIEDGAIVLIDELDVVWHEDLLPAMARWPEVLQLLAEQLGTHCSFKKQAQQH